MQLVPPSLDYKDQYLNAIEESKHEVGISILPRPLENQSFEDFIKDKFDQEKGINLPMEFVASSEFWLIDHGEFIGRTNLRHTLNNHLLEIGGHIGYWIRPSKRGKGYGKKILELALPEMQKLGISSVLVTCDIDNIPSAKVIEANGGILENIVPNGADNPPKKRFWITI